MIVTVASCMIRLGQHVRILAAATSLLLFLAAASETRPFDDSTDRSCTRDQVLLQVGRSISKKSAHVPAVAAGLLQVAGIGATAPLDEAGYQSVATKCCGQEMMVFAKRVLESEGMQLCDEGGLTGTVIWFDCADEKQSYSNLVEKLREGVSGDCPYLRNGPDCAPMKDTCQAAAAVGALSPPLPSCGSTSPCTLSKMTKIDLSKTDVLHNNVGGKGPKFGDPQELRFGGSQSAGTSSAGTSEIGEPFDIVVTTESTDYDPGAGIENGLWGKDYGKVSVNAVSDSGITGRFKFSFVKPGTNDPVTLAEIHLTVFDIDGTEEINGKTGLNEEYASSRDCGGFVLDPNTYLKEQVSDGRTWFAGTADLDASGLANGADAIDDDHRRASVMFFYHSVASFEVEFRRGNKGGPSGMLFAFSSRLNELCVQ